MVKVIGIKFKTSCRIYYFDPLDLPFHAGDGAIVETSRGIEFGEVTCDPKEVEESEIVAPLKPVLRIATEEDKQMREMYRAKEPEAMAICEEKIKEHGLDMKLVDAEYIFNGSKIVFYFTADERVDFRDLVKDLAYLLRTRIELRQIGVRDEAKMLGGLGPCGRPICCKAFLDDFRPVSIKMAKEQNLSLSPTKISGLCGRLMCCLQYEQCVYDEMKKLMPKVGKEINTVDGTGVVVENNAITEKTKVKLTMEDGTIDIREYPYTHLGPVGEPLPQEATEKKKQEEQAAKDPAVTPKPAFTGKNSKKREKENVPAEPKKDSAEDAEKKSEQRKSDPREKRNPVPSEKQGNANAPKAQKENAKNGSDRKSDKNPQEQKAGNPQQKGKPQKHSNKPKDVNQKQPEEQESKKQPDGQKQGGGASKRNRKRRRTHKPQNKASETKSE